MSRAQVDALRAMLAARPANASLADRRIGFERMAGSFPLPADLSTEPVEIRPGLGGLWVWTQGAARDRAILWLHGGQFVLGSSQSYRHFAARLSRESGARVLLLDYALAPERPFPAALGDVDAALTWLAEQGWRGANLALGGDSAGANLALSSLQAKSAHQSGAAAALYLISPYLDLTHRAASIKIRASRDPFVDPATMDIVAQTYLAGASPTDPRASPLRGSFTNLPPTLIQVGADEALFDDAQTCAESMRQAGVPVVFQEWVGMIHVFPFFADRVDEGVWALAQAGQFLRERLAPDAQ